MEKSIEESLVCLLSYVKHSNDELILVNKLASEISDWNYFKDLVIKNRTIPLIYKRMVSLQLDKFLPREIAQHFADVTTKIASENQNRLEAAGVFLDECGDNDIEVVILKGNFFAQTIYNDFAYKKMNDLDILIKKSDAKKVLDILNKLEFFALGEFGNMSAADQIRTSHHFPPFFNKKLTLMLGIHWELVNPSHGYQLDYERMWKRTADFVLGGVRVKSLYLLDNLHHLCIHLSAYKSGIKEVADIYNLIRFFASDLAWEDFLLEVQEAKTQDQVYLALSIANRFDPRADVEKFLGRLKPDNSTLKLVSKKVSSFSFLLNSRTVHISRIEKAYSRFKLTNVPRERWVAFVDIWKNLLWPPSTELEYLSFSKNYLLGRFLAPWCVARKLCEDLGARLFFLLLFYLCYAMVKTYIKSFFFKPTKSLDLFARQMGISQDDLKDLQDNLE